MTTFKNSLLLIILLYPCLHTFGQEREVITQPEINIDGYVKDKPEAVREIPERESYREAGRGRDYNSKEKPKPGPKVLNDATVNNQLEETLEYFSVYSNLSTYETAIDGNGKVTIKSLVALSIWDEPDNVEISPISPSADQLKFNADKTDFAREVRDLVVKSRNPNTKTLEAKAEKYIYYSQYKEDMRRFMEIQNFNYLAQNNLTVQKALNLHVQGANTFNQLEIAMSRGYKTPFNNFNSLASAKVLFFSNVQIAKKLMNPYSLAHQSVKEKGINPETYAERLLKVSQEVLDFANGLRDGVRFSVIQLQEAGYAIVSITKMSINNPYDALSYTWDVITSTNPAAILSSLIYNVYEKLGKLDNGTPYEKGVIIGNFVTGVLTSAIGGTVTNYVSLQPFLTFKATKLLDEISPIINNSVGSISTSKMTLFKVFQSRALIKHINNVVFKRAQVQKKIAKHGADFGVSNPNSTSNENLTSFAKKMKAHMKNKSTIAVNGTFKDTNPINVVIYYNHRTRLMVMLDSEDKYLSGWKLNDKQVSILLRKQHISNLK